MSSSAKPQNSSVHWKRRRLHSDKQRRQGGSSSSASKHPVHRVAKETIWYAFLQNIFVYHSNMSRRMLYVLRNHTPLLLTEPTWEHLALYPE